jgi:hypothetical protein
MEMMSSLLETMEGRSDGRDEFLNVYGSNREIVLECPVEIDWLVDGEYWVGSSRGKVQHMKKHVFLFAT